MINIRYLDRDDKFCDVKDLIHLHLFYHIIIIYPHFQRIMLHLNKYYLLLWRLFLQSVGTGHL